jgi:putative toxin-antitoxin system antitoxin component (TIGR02293 family)
MAKKGSEKTVVRSGVGGTTAAKVLKRHASSGQFTVRNSEAKSFFASYKSLSGGIPSRAVRALEESGVTRDDIRQIIPDRTLERRIAQGENLKLEEADGLARLVRVVALAQRVFEDDALADEWLRTPNPALDDLVPIQMARTDLGGREVEAVLLRLEHGVFS